MHHCLTIKISIEEERTGEGKQNMFLDVRIKKKTRLRLKQFNYGENNQPCLTYYQLPWLLYQSIIK